VLDLCYISEEKMVENQFAKSTMLNRLPYALFTRTGSMVCEWDNLIWYW